MCVPSLVNVDLEMPVKNPRWPPRNLGFCFTFPAHHRDRLVCLFILQKPTKNIIETGRTFSSLFTDLRFRHQLASVNSKEDFRRLLRERAGQMMRAQGEPDFRQSTNHVASVFDDDVKVSCSTVFWRCQV